MQLPPVNGCTFRKHNHNNAAYARFVIFYENNAAYASLVSFYENHYTSYAPILLQF